MSNDTKNQVIQINNIPCLVLDEKECFHNKCCKILEGEKINYVYFREISNQWEYLPNLGKDFNWDKFGNVIVADDWVEDSDCYEL